MTLMAGRRATLRHVDERPSLSGLTLNEGAELVKAAVGPVDLAAIAEALADQPPDQAGIRLFGMEALRQFLEPKGVVDKVAASRMPGAVRPVRAILFDKTETTNWSLAWHQDRVIAVRERIDAPGFGPWSRKHGTLHVAPPVQVFSKMLTLRVHLDHVTPDNAPLLIAPGSHLMGRIAEADVADVVARCGVVECLAERGDVWVYATPILHASEAAKSPARRRVLQVDYAADDLPYGLEWLGV